MTIVIKVFGDKALAIADMLENGIEPKTTFQKGSVEGRTVIEIRVSA